MSTCLSPECAPAEIPRRSAPVGGPMSLLPRWGAVLARGLRAMERAHRLRSDARRLHEMSDAMLADIGVSRGDIDHAVRYGSLPGERGRRSERDGIHAPH